MRELCLIRGYDHGDDRSPWLECLEAFLRTVIKNEFHIIKNCVPECSTTSRLYASHYRCGNSGLDRYSVVQEHTQDLEQTVGRRRAIGYTLARHASKIQDAHRLG